MTIITAISSRHPELVSGSIFPLSQAAIGARWMLSRQATEGKRVQHDDARTAILAQSHKATKSERAFFASSCLRASHLQDASANVEIAFQ